MMPPAPRILMTADAVGGVCVYAVTLARELCRRNCHVTLVTLGPPPQGEQLRAVEAIRGLALEVTDLALEWMDPDGLDLPRACQRLARLEEAVEPDLVHLNGYREALAPWHAPVLVAAHSCVQSWWRACRGGLPQEAEWSTYAANVCAGLAAADQWVAPSAAFRETVEALYGPPASGHVIPNGIGDGIRASAKEPFILGAGRLWDEAKNVAILGEIALRLPWPIRIAGPLAHDAARADQRNATDGLVAIGELSRASLIQEMQRASVFVSAAVYEPFGLTVLEAAAAGCALVLSDLPTFRELWEGAALFVDPRDQRMLRSVLTHLVNNEPLRRDLQRRARHCAGRYTAAAMGDAYQSFYRSMLKARRATPPPRQRASVEARP